MRMNSLAGFMVSTAVAAAGLTASAGSLPDVGSAAPPLQLAGADGGSRSLAATDGPKVLIFYRGLWWPFCRAQLGELQKNLKAFAAKGAEIWAISPEPADRLAKFAAQEGIGYTLLSDPDLTVIEGWGLVNPANPKVPHPTAVIVDAEGIVRYVRQDLDYTHRPTPGELLDVLASID
jgi:peroxiredoxin